VLHGTLYIKCVRMIHDLVLYYRYLGFGIILYVRLESTHYGSFGAALVADWGFPLTPSLAV
jgi:hypothetical protein